MSENTFIVAPLPDSRLEIFSFRIPKATLSCLSASSVAADGSPGYPALPCDELLVAVVILSPEASAISLSQLKFHNHVPRSGCVRVPLHLNPPLSKFWNQQLQRHFQVKPVFPKPALVTTGRSTPLSILTCSPHTKYPNGKVTEQESGGNLHFTLTADYSVPLLHRKFVF